MPHSPRLVGEELYLLNGGKGEVLRIDRVSGEGTVLATLPGFTHGLCETRRSAVRGTVAKSDIAQGKTRRPSLNRSIG